LRRSPQVRPRGFKRGSGVLPPVHKLTGAGLGHLTRKGLIDTLSYRSPRGPSQGQAGTLDRVDTPEDIWEQAAQIQEALTEQAQHYDRDFDTIARFTEQPARWIVPPGTV
jgi:hypothetical protein